MSNHNTQNFFSGSDDPTEERRAPDGDSARGNTNATRASAPLRAGLSALAGSSPVDVDNRGRALGQRVVSL